MNSIRIGDITINSWLFIYLYRHGNKYGWTDSNRLVYWHTFPSFIYQEGLEAITPPQQQG